MFPCQFSHWGIYHTRTSDPLIIDISRGSIRVNRYNCVDVHHFKNRGKIMKKKKYIKRSRGAKGYDKKRCQLSILKLRCDHEGIGLAEARRHPLKR